MRFLVRRIAPQYASPSMRREWIEMILSLKITSWNMRLPPCGGSGLKCAMQQKHQKKRTSPSMRREWIEIPDRRYSLHNADSLPPCGGSGLK